ncbi:Lysine histidine transporter-like 1 [Platanthera guangdongensis]|uniref:Lysine histidine transporter-like 1 n=1 Tax=Platanthera guangdongensis TaxID=2320717 RepID=A0ABR2N1H6_9ASPA
MLSSTVLLKCPIAHDCYQNVAEGNVDVDNDEALPHGFFSPSYDKAYGKLSTPALTMTVALWKAEYHHFAFLDLWGPRVAILILSWIITLYTLWQMVEMHEMVSGKRFDRYHELG